MLVECLVRASECVRHRFLLQDLGQVTISASTSLICEIELTHQPCGSSFLMRIRRGDTALGRHLVHSKHSINGIHVAKALTNGINSPAPRSDPEAGQGCQLGPLCSMPPALLPHPQVGTPKPGPVRCTEAPFSGPASPRPLLGDPAW